MLVDDVDGLGQTALHIASRYNQTEVINNLLHKGAKVNRQDGYIKDTPLHFAARHDHTKAVRILIKNGADVNLQNNGQKTPLDYAYKDSEVKSLLLQHQKKSTQ